jgi:hypothetical protein
LLACPGPQSPPYFPFSLSGFLPPVPLLVPRGGDRWIPTLSEGIPFLLNHFQIFLDRDGTVMVTLSLNLTHQFTPPAPNISESLSGSALPSRVPCRRFRPSPTHSIGGSSNKKSIAHWRFDPVGSPGFHSRRFTDHGSRITNCHLFSAQAPSISVELR